MSTSFARLCNQKVDKEQMFNYSICNFIVAYKEAVVQRLNVEQRTQINARPERVWEALTNADQIIAWFAPALAGMGAVMKRDESDKLAIYFGEMGTDFAQLRIVESKTKLVLTALPDNLLSVTYRLERQEDATSVTVTLDGLEQLPENMREGRLELSNSGWENALANLKAYVEGTDLLYPQALTSPLFGFWREIDNQLAIERSIWTAAAPEQVWEAIIDPQQIQAWFSPNTVWQRSAPEVGGKLYVNNEETGGEMYVEVIETCDVPNRLVTQAIPEPPDTVVKTKTYTLREENRGTRLTLTLAGYEQEPEETRWAHMEQDTSGFGMMLQNTKAHLEGKPLPFPWGF
jgi:uncharacterized protein YndB with AHSA1/START domain